MYIIKFKIFECSFKISFFINNIMSANIKQIKIIQQKIIKIKELIRKS
jgi:hypothetical protein